MEHNLEIIMDSDELYEALCVPFNSPKDIREGNYTSRFDSDYLLLPNPFDSLRFKATRYDDSWKATFSLEHCGKLLPYNFEGLSARFRKSLSPQLRDRWTPQNAEGGLFVAPPKSAITSFSITTLFGIDMYFNDFHSKTPMKFGQKELHDQCAEMQNHINNYLGCVISHLKDKGRLEGEFNLQYCIPWPKSKISIKPTIQPLRSLAIAS